MLMRGVECCAGRRVVWAMMVRLLGGGDDESGAKQCRQVVCERAHSERAASQACYASRGRVASCLFQSAFPICARCKCLVWGMGR
eukprot:2410550-Pleurochrysis_carterae.AAC.1